MKIKLLKPIPGMLSDTCEVEGSTLAFPGGSYQVQWLLQNGWAEEIKKEFDLEEIKQPFLQDLRDGAHKDGYSFGIGYEEADWFTAYRIVKAVIEKLNGGWKPDWENEPGYGVCYRYDKTVTTHSYICNTSLLPSCKDTTVVEKVIELCGPELKILFNIED